MSLLCHFVIVIIIIIIVALLLILSQISMYISMGVRVLPMKQRGQGSVEDDVFRTFVEFIEVFSTLLSTK